MRKKHDADHMHVKLGGMNYPGDMDDTTRERAGVCTALDLPKVYMLHISPEPSTLRRIVRLTEVKI